jgi:hypothetical protein
MAISTNFIYNIFPHYEKKNIKLKRYDDYLYFGLKGEIMYLFSSISWLILAPRDGKRSVWNSSTQNLMKIFLTHENDMIGLNPLG